MAAMLRDSVVVVAFAVVGTRPRTIPPAMIIMRKSTHGFPFLSVSNRDSLRKAREAFLIQKGRTIDPNGLNIREETY